MKVGVLALQGDYASHQKRLTELGARAVLVRKASDLPAISALVLPGGESTAMLRLMDEDFRLALRKFIAEGNPTLGTCAGVILAAKRVESPAQESLGVLDVTAVRNAYGRQLDSFIDPELGWTEAGKQSVRKLDFGAKIAEQPIEGVFIRAPRIVNVGPKVQVLVERRGEPVLVRDGMFLGATFHPELSDEAMAVHQLFLKLA